MNTATFLEKFDLIAEIPNAVEKMRGLVLDLAFSGKLCQSKSKWKTNKLKALTSKIGSGATPSGGRESYFSEGIPLIRSMNVHFGGFEPKGLVFLSEDQARQLSNVIVQPQDVLLNITGASIGRVTNAPTEMAGARVNQHVTIIRVSELLNPEFLAKYLASPSVQRMINEIQVGATRQALTKGMIEQFEIPHPPLEEQKRIVARVDELMALCDQLEARQKERDEKHKALCRAALARFSDDPTPANLEYLFHPSFKIPPDDLRKTILTLAVQGKLVEQDLKNRLVRISQTDFNKKKGKWAKPIEEKELPFAIPFTWEWVRLGDIAYLKHGFAFSSKFFTEIPGSFVLTTPGNFYEKGGFRDRESKRKYYSGTIDPEFILNPGDLIIPMTEQAAGLLGSPAFIPDDGRIYIHNQRLGKITFRESVLPEFAFWFFNTDFFRGELSKTSTGMKVRHTSPDRVLKVPFPVPSLGEQRRILAKISRLINLVVGLEIQFEELENTELKLLKTF